MYLRTSEWSMRRRRRPSNPITIIFLVIVIGAGIYFNQFIAPDVTLPGEPTAAPTRAPESYVTEANKYFDEGQLLLAIDSYQQAIQLLPADPSLYISLARSQIYFGRYGDAQISAENALLLNNNDPRAHALRGWALYFQDDPLGAEAAIQKALDLDANNAMAHAFYAEILADQYASGTFGIDTLEKMSNASQMAIQLAPNSIEANRARGYVLEVTGNPQQAIEAYEAALLINPNIAEIHSSIGRVYYSLEVYDKAFDEFSRAYALNPTDTTPNAYIARIYAKQGVYAKAAQYAEQAVNDDPVNARWRGLLGTMYYRAEDYAKAAEQFAYVVFGGKTTDGRDVLPLDLTLNDYRISEYYYIYGLTLVNLNRCNEAVPIFNQVLNDVPNDEFATYNATEGLRICAESIGVTPSPDAATPEGESTPEATPTP